MLLGKTLLKRGAIIFIASLLALAAPSYGQTTQPVLYSGTGHYYQYVQFTPSICWTAARDFAIAQGGYLATIHSAGENSFIRNTFQENPSRSAWLGGFEPNNNGVWVWANGEPWDYTNWNPGEPSNTGGNENYLAISGGSYWQGRWNDAADCNPPVGLIIEFDSDPSLSSTPRYFYGTGHYYQVVPTSGTMTWDQCRDAAIAMGGYLATVSNQSENDFLLSLPQPGVGTYIGGFESSPGVWAWVSGEPWSYTSWNSGEPSNVTPERETSLEMYTSLSVSPRLPGRWNNIMHNAISTEFASYVVEFSSTPPPPTGLVAFWPLDETSGNTAADASPNGLSGTAHNANIIDGVSGKARSFNGLTSYIEVPQNGLLNLTSGITIMLWAKIDPTESEGFLINKRLQSDVNCQINYDIKYGLAAGQPFLAFQYGTGCTTGNNYMISNLTGLNDNNWHHLAFSLQFGSPTTAQWVVDGAQKTGQWTHWNGSSGGGNDLPPTNSYPLEIGRQLSTSPGYFNGSLDQVRVYNRTLDVSEITQIYQAEHSGQPTPVPHIAVTETSHDFGRVGIGNSSDWNFTIQNTGNASLQLITISSDNAVFSVISPSTFPGVISPNQSENVTIRFSPPNATSYTGHLAIASNDPNEPSLGIDLTGNGTAQETELVFGVIHIKGDIIYQTTDGKKVVKGNVTINQYLHFTDSLIVDPSRLSVSEAGQIYIEYLGQRLILYDGDSEFGLLGPDGVLTDFIGSNIKQQLQLAGIKVTLKDLALLSDGVQIAGRLDFRLPQMSKPVVISINNLTVSNSTGVHVAGQVNVPTIDLLGAIQLTNTQLNFDTDSSIFAGYTRAKTPLVAIGGGATIRSGQLDRVKLTIELGQPIPIGGTGIFLAGGGGELSGIASPPLYITLTVDLTGGPSIGSTYIVELKDFGLRVSPPDFLEGMGKLKVFGQNVASGSIGYRRGIIGAEGKISLIDVLKADLAASLDDQRFSGSATGELSIPDGEGFPYDLIKTVVSLPYEVGDVEMSVSNDSLVGEFKVSRTFDVFGHEVTLELQLAGALLYEPPDVAFYLGQDLEHLQQIAVASSPKIASVGTTILNAASSSGADFMIEPGLKQIIFRWEGTAAVPQCAVQAPGGHDYLSTDFDSSALRGVFFQAVLGRDVMYCIVNDPVSGLWHTELEGSQSSGYQLDAYALAQKPGLVMDKVEVLGSSTERITWHTGSISQDWKVSLYYDDNGRDQDGTFIAGGIPLASQSMQYDWNIASVPTGRYYVYAKIEDGKHAPVIAYSPEAFDIINPAAPQPPSNLQGNDTANGVLLGWVKSSSPNVLGYVIAYADRVDNDEYTYHVSVGDTSQYLLSDVLAGRQYRIAVKAFDTAGVQSRFSNEITYQLISSTHGNYPTIVSKPPLVLKYGLPYSYTLSASDPDGDAISTSLVTGPTGMAVVNGNTVLWPANLVTLGRNAISLAVDDGTGRADSQSFVLEVYPAEAGIGTSTFDKEVYIGRGAQAVLIVKDKDLDTDPWTYQSVTVHVSSKTDPKGFDTPLIESAASSGVFTGFVGLDVTPSNPSLRQLQVSSGDSLTLLYNDQSSTTTVSGHARWFKAASGAFEGYVNPVNNITIGSVLEVYDESGHLISTLTPSSTGRYAIDSLINGNYSIIIRPALGYVTDSAQKFFTVYCESSEVDFALTKVADVAKVQLLPSLWYSSWTGSSAGTVRGYIGNIPAGHTASNIVPSSIRLDGQVPIFGGSYRIRPNMTGFAGLVMEVAFSRQLAVQSLPQPLTNDTHTVMITGDFTDGNKFVAAVDITLSGAVPKETAGEDTTAVETENVPTEFSLGDAHPNPFNPATTIEFALPAAGQVRLEVINTLGQKVKTLVDAYMPAGTHSIEWNSTDDNGSSVASGVYLYRLQAGDFTETKKMVLMK